MSLIHYTMFHITFYYNSITSCAYIEILFYYHYQAYPHNLFTPFSYSISVEYSTTYGRSWHEIQSECLPPSHDCHLRRYQSASVFHSIPHHNYTRITLRLPSGAVLVHNSSTSMLHHLYAI